MYPAGVTSQQQQKNRQFRKEEKDSVLSVRAAVSATSAATNRLRRPEPLTPGRRLLPVPLPLPPYPLRRRYQSSETHKGERLPLLLQGSLSYAIVVVDTGLQSSDAPASADR